VAAIISQGVIGCSRTQSKDLSGLMAGWYEKDASTSLRMNVDATGGAIEIPRTLGMTTLTTTFILGGARGRMITQHDGVATTPDHFLKSSSASFFS
jgi:hypothetical protein